MANVTLPENLSDLLSAAALGSGLQSPAEVKSDAALVGLLQQAGFGSIIVARSVTYSELATLDVPEFTTVMVSDVPETGSLWQFVGGNWKPMNGLLSYSSFAGGDFRNIAYNDPDQTILDVPFAAGFIKPDIIGDFFTALTLTDIPETPFAFTVELYGKKYLDNTDITDGGIQFSTQTSLPFANFSMKFMVRRYSYGEGNNSHSMNIAVFYSNAAGESAFLGTDILATQPWGFRVKPLTTLTEGLSPITLFMYNVNLQFL